MFEPSILKSTDNGESWEENILEEFFMIQNFTSSGKNLFLTFSNQIFYSSDMGTSWSSIPNGNWSTSGFSAIGINNAGNIFASIGTEVYVTTDMGISWTLKNTGLSSNAVLNKFFFNDDGYIFRYYILQRHIQKLKFNAYYCNLSDGKFTRRLYIRAELSEPVQSNHEFGIWDFEFGICFFESI